MSHSMRWAPAMSRSIVLFVLLVLLAGCSWIGDEPTEAELAAEQLRQPPDVLSDARQQTPNRDQGSASADRVVSESAQADDPLSLLSVIDGAPVLDLGLPIDAAWAVVGRALERSGFALLGSDREASTHRIRYDSSVAGEVVVDEDNGGFLSGLNFWRSEPEAGLQEFDVLVVERGKGARVTVETTSGEPAPRGAAQQVLAVLAEQLKP